MKKYLLLLFHCCLFNSLEAQNLVLNSSFEEVTFKEGGNGCSAGIIDSSKGWENFGGTPDYYNACVNNRLPQVGVPTNQAGYQMAHSGSAYAGLITFYTPSQREFVGTQLMEPLKIGITYFVSAYISRPGGRDSSFMFPSPCASNNFGFNFSTIKYSYDNPVQVNNFSQIHSNTIITDTLNWVKISGSFIADSAYKYLIIGNFYEDSQTDTIGCGNLTYTGGYYFVDDVCVSADSLCGSLGVKKSNILDVSLYPNPCQDYLNIKFNKIIAPIIQIFNSVGEKIIEKKIDSNEISIDMHSVSAGLYVAKVIFNNQPYFYKFQKQ